MDEDVGVYPVEDFDLRLSHIPRCCADCGASTAIAQPPHLCTRCGRVLCDLCAPKHDVEICLFDDAGELWRFLFGEEFDDLDF